MTSNFLKLQTLGYKNITANIYRIQASDSIKYGYYILDDFMIKGQSLLEYTNLFFPKEYEKKKIYKIFLSWIASKNVTFQYCIKCNKYRKFISIINF